MLTPRSPKSASSKAPRFTSVDPVLIRQIKEIDSVARPGFFKELVYIFLTSVEEHLTSLIHSVAAQDYSKTEREAHFIKGSAGNFGAHQVTSICCLVETQAREHNTPRLEMLIYELRAALESLKCELKLLIDDHVAI